MDHLRADIENKQTDTFYKRGLLRYEPWKVAAGFFAAGAGLMAAAGAFAAIIFHMSGVK